MTSKSPPFESTESDDKSNNEDGQEAEAFAARLRDRAEELRISRSNLISWTGIRKQTFAGYWNGERLPPAHALLQLSEELDVSPRWLLTGERESVSERRQSYGAPPALEHDDLVDVAEVDLRYGLGATYLDSAVETEPRQFSRAWLRHFTDSPPGELFWARGQGNSMETTIHESDIVLIDRSDRTPRMSDLIWAFAFGEIGMIKRLRPMPDGSVKILSDNAAVPPETAHDEEIHIIGRVVAVVKKL